MEIASVNVKWQQALTRMHCEIVLPISINGYYGYLKGSSASNNTYESSSQMAQNYWVS